ncbi:MAG: ATP synthase F1 subunit delta [Deltaproteobacteria bacterium]|nr:ATP synthase F1 subunit delta [Deltaproteobacteria bacterium]
MASTDNQLSSRYAKAFLQVLNEIGKKDLEVFEQDLQTLQMLAQGEQGVFFASPLFSQEEKKLVLEKFCDAFHFQKESIAFIHALNENTHLSLLAEVAAFFTKERLAQENQIRVQLKTAYALESDQESRMTKIFETVFGKKVFIEKTVDPTLIGGISANVGGVVYDASIAGYLDRLEKQFNG